MFDCIKSDMDEKRTELLFHKPREVSMI